MSELDRPPLWKVWLLAARPATLPAGAAPVLAGCAIAFAHGALVPTRALAALAAALLVQIGTNLANDYFDFKKGADTEARVGPARASQRGWLPPAAVARGAALALAGAGFAGLYLAYVGGWPVLAIAVISLVCAVAYTGGPYPLAYVGLGDVFVLVFFGPVAVAGTVYVNTLTWQADGVVAGLALGLLATAILVVNNLRDRHTDAIVGKRTLAVRLGERFSRWQYAVAVLSAFALTTGWGLSIGHKGWLWPLVLLPMALLRVQQVWVADGTALNPHLGTTGKLLFGFSVVLSAGLVLTIR